MVWVSPIEKGSTREGTGKAVSTWRGGRYEKPLPLFVAEDVGNSDMVVAQVLPLISPRACSEAGFGTFLQPTWESCRGCQGFIGPAPSALLDEHKLLRAFNRAIIAGFRVQIFRS